MILAGDEWGRTQQGNNNPYCQDNELSWLDWNLDAEQSALLEFVCTLVRLKLDEPVLHRPKFFQGRPIRGTDIRDIWWLESNGQEMTDESWDSSFVRCLGVYKCRDKRRNRGGGRSPSITAGACAGLHSDIRSSASAGPRSDISSRSRTQPCAGRTGAG
jgi:pullulanase/glycogen debranching enzyme